MNNEKKKVTYMGVDCATHRNPQTAICVISINIEESRQFNSASIEEALQVVREMAIKHDVDTICIDAGNFNEPLALALQRRMGDDQKLSTVRFTGGTQIHIKGHFSDVTAFTTACLAATAIDPMYLPTNLTKDIKWHSIETPPPSRFRLEDY